MDDSKKQRMSELTGELTSIVLEGIRGAIGSQPFKTCAQKLAQECGRAIIGIGLETVEGELKFSWSFQEIQQIEPVQESNESVEADKTLTGSSFEITQKDRKILKGMHIRIDDEDIIEMRETIFGKIEKDKKLLSPGEDVRTVETMAQDVKACFEKIRDLKMRKIIAKRVNLALGFDMPISDELIDDAFWRRQADEVIKYVKECAGSDESIKDTLSSVEIMTQDSSEGD